jgi:hypothetical protein
VLRNDVPLREQCPGNAHGQTPAGVVSRVTTLSGFEETSNETHSEFCGRSGVRASRVEAREKLAAEANAKQVRTCVELGKCALMKADEKALSTTKAARASSWNDEFYRAKYGRALPEAREQVHLSAAHVTFEHECCRRSD